MDNKKKKLLRITTVSLSLNSLLKGQLAFLNQYYEVVGVASNKDFIDLVAQREGVRTIEIKMKREISVWDDLKSLYLLVNLFRKEKPYIVHANTPKGSLLSMIAAWLTKIPHRIYTVTGLRFETTSGRFRNLLIWMERVTCWCATKVIPEGEGVKKTLLKEKITGKPLKVILNGNINGVDINYFRRTPELEAQSDGIIEKEKFTFCFVGRLVKDKGIHELVQAFLWVNSLYRDTRLLLVGKLERELDPLKCEIEKEILENTSIKYVGYQSDIRPYLIASDVFTFPSYREGFPNVLLQAGAMGLPAIVTDINGSNEIVKDGVNGIIIPPKSEKRLIDAMLMFYENRNDEIRKMSANARSNIVERFEQRKVWEAILKEYQLLDLK